MHMKMRWCAFVVSLLSLSLATWAFLTVRAQRQEAESWSDTSTPVVWETPSVRFENTDMSMLCTIEGVEGARRRTMQRGERFRYLSCEEYDAALAHACATTTVRQDFCWNNAWICWALDDCAGARQPVWFLVSDGADMTELRSATTDAVISPYVYSPMEEE